MNRILWSRPDEALLLLRLAVGLGMLTHGWPKLMKYSEMSQGFPDPLGVGSSLSLTLAIFAELGCSLMLILGFLTPLAAVPLAITMAVAFFIVHAEDPWQRKELAALYLSIYAVLLVSGPGRYSLDHLLFGKKD